MPNTPPCCRSTNSRSLCWESRWPRYRDDVTPSQQFPFARQQARGTTRVDIIGPQFRNMRAPLERAGERVDIALRQRRDAADRSGLIHGHGIFDEMDRIDKHGLDALGG